MVKHTKTGAYEHFCILIFAQGTWKEADREKVRNLIRDKIRNKKNTDYNLFNKLVYRDQMPIYADCHICQPIYKMFEEFKGNSNGIFYQGHHYLIPEEDIDDMKSLINMVISHDKVKKIYLLYLDAFGEIKRTILNDMNLEKFKEQLSFKKCKSNDFVSIIDSGKFKNRTVYEISKSRGIYN